MANLLIVKETSEGEFESRGEKYFSFDIFDLDKLDALSKKAIEEKNLVQQWADEENGDPEDYEPMNGIDWSWEDLEESLNCGKSKYEKVMKDRREFDTEIYRIDTSDAKERQKLVKLLKENKSNSTYQTQLNSVFIEYALTEFFSKEEIKDINITDSVSFKTRGIVDVSIGNDIISVNF